MSSLTRHICAYISERKARGEFTRQTAKDRHYQLGTLDRSFGNRPVEQLSKRAIERWLETIGHLSPGSRRGCLSAVRCFCRWLVERGVIASDPTEKIPTIKRPRTNPRAMSGGDIGRLADVLPDHRARAIVSLMVGCGLRCVEVSRLQTTDWDPENLTIEVTGKGGHKRTLPVPGETVRYVDAYLRTVGGGIAGPLIRSERHGFRGLSAATISTYVSRWMADAGLKSAPWDGRSAHAMRHTAASDVLDQCNDLRVVQEMLGHAHLATTSIYLRRAQIGQMRTAMEGRRYLDDADVASVSILRAA